MTSSFTHKLASTFLGRKLRTVLIVPFALQIISAVGLVGYLATENGQRAIAMLANDLMEEVEGKIAERIGTYIKHPHTINQLNQAAIELGQLDPTDLKSLEKHFWKQSQIFEDVGYIQFGNEAKEFVGLAVNDDGTTNYQVTESTGNLNTYNISLTGDRLSKISTAQGFDPVQRPWYITPKEADRPAWTDIYAWVNPPTLAITLGQPYYNNQGTFEGILATDLTLAQISDFLREVDIGKSGQTFIIERSGLMVATSTKEQPFYLRDELPKRISALNSQDPQTRAAVQFLEQEYGDFNNIDWEKQHTFDFNGEKQFLYVKPLKDGQGLDWLTVIVVSENDFLGQIHHNTRNTILLCIGAGIFTVLIGIITARLISQPVLSINQAAKAIATGQFEHDVAKTNIKELDELSSSFNNMASQLKSFIQRMTNLNAALSESEQELADTNKNLEEQVQQQTQELVQSEKMAALGQLTAGIAHEINTPLGVIQASSENIESAFVAAMQKLPSLLQSLPEEELKGFFTLLEESRNTTALLSSREERKLKKAIKKKLQELEIEPVAPIASTLSKMSLSTEVDGYLAVLQAPNNTEILDAVYQLSVVQNNSGNIQHAIQRVSKIVFALKSYARHDLSSRKAKGSIPQSIETVLTLYHNQLKQNIEVTTDLESLPEIWCYPEELSQVWTNLIHNAIQAMNYQGHLRLRAYERDQSIWVEVTDSGKGIPPEIQSKIFTPFFTTKPAGEGNGLGLDIVSKIIQKHDGQITVESQPGETTFRVQIPILLEEPPVAPPIEDAIASSSPIEQVL